MNSLKLILTQYILSFSFGLKAQSSSADLLSVFTAKNYPDSTYHVFHHEYQFSRYHISLANLRLINNEGCRSFVLITKGQDTIYHKCFPSISSNGGSDGVFSSDSNTFSDYFFISKFGDYDGRLIILDKAGKIHDIRGTSFYISKDHTFVFSNQDSDIGGLTIWNLSKNKLLYDSEERFNQGDFTVGERFLWQIRYDKNYHYLIYLKDIQDKDDTKLFVLKFENYSGKLTHENINSIFLLSLPVLSVKNSGDMNRSCSCNDLLIH